MNRRRLVVVLAAAAVGIGAAGCVQDGGDPVAAPTTTDAPTTMTLTSTAFGDGGEIPERYSCEGLNLNPPLVWTGAPDDTEAFAVVAEDPDAPGGIFVHWVVTGLPAETAQIAEGGEDLPPGAVQSQTSSGSSGYVGMCPPNGETHTYTFTVYALDESVTVAEATPPDEAIGTIRAAATAKGTVRGRFSR